VPVTLDQRAGRTVVDLRGDLDIQAAAELKGILLAALRSRQELRVELAGVTALDITTLQLLSALERAATKAGLDLLWGGPISEETGLAMDLAGLERPLVDPR
jgi:anti-anti-sigma regulatory factor